MEAFTQFARLAPPAATHDPTKGRRLRAASLALLAICVGLFASPPAASASSVEPELVDGNATCRSENLGAVAVKIEPPKSGTFSLDDASAAGPIAAAATSGSVNTATVTFRSTLQGQVFDWSSTLGVDAVIVKGGPDSNAYVYDPPSESTGDTGLHAPENASGGFADVSHISFCFDYELEVSKTAETSLKRTWDWTIDKTATPAKWNLFRGDTGTSVYKVDVTRTGHSDSDWAATGKITVKNPTPFTVSTTITDKVSPAITAAVTCPGGSTTQQLAPKASVVCSYQVALPDGATRENVATASAPTGTSVPIAGGTGKASVDFASAKITQVNDKVNVTDSFNGSLGELSASRSITYSRKFSCDADADAHDNTATIVETGQKASASVDVQCNALTVSKTAKTSVKRNYEWTIDKSWSIGASLRPASKMIATGESFLTDYAIEVDATTRDSDHKVTGEIQVTNPAAIAATIKSVSDVVSGVTTADDSADCPVTFPHKLAAGATLTCQYTRSVPNADARTNTATATLQNHDYNASGATSAGTTAFTGQAPVSFADAAVTHVNRTVAISDEQAPEGVLPSELTFDPDKLPASFKYAKRIGPYSTCGPRTIDNEANLVGSDGATIGSSKASFIANVQCKLTVVKKLVPSTDTGKFDLLIDGVVAAENVGHDGSSGAKQVSLGNHLVTETAGTATRLSDYIATFGGDCAANGSVSFAAGDSDKTCVVTNTKKGRATLQKTTNGAVNPALDIQFELSGPGLSSPVRLSTINDADGVLDFGHVLQPSTTTTTYTICETPVPAGFSSLWKLDGVIVTPYNPDAKQSPPQDLGTRCYDFDASAGQTKAFVVDNSRPGGDPRTIGYWKNWNKCTGGNQATVAAKNGGVTNGFFLVEDLLAVGTPPVGALGNFTAATCAQAVKVLSKQDQNGKNQASDAAYELAAQLLAAKLNLGAGAESCSAVQTAVTDAQALLVAVNWNGLGTYLTKTNTNRTKALSLAATLDKYNNGNVC